jgi:hypothetical protein
MAHLERMLSQFIENENIIRDADNEIEKLQVKHKSLLENVHRFTVDQAEDAYNSFQAIIKHRGKVEEAKSKLLGAVEVIKKYFEATDRMPISYVHPSGIQYRTYTFELNEKDEVIHNHQKR